MADNFKNTRVFLRQYANSVESEIETRLANAGKEASGALYDSIRYEIKEDNTRFVLTFSMLDYGRFVDKGVQGAKTGKAGEGGSSQYKFTNKMPPPEAIEKWLSIKGIAKEASYPIRRHIFNVGITPTNFFTIPTTRRLKQFGTGYAKAMAKDVEQEIKRQSKRK